MELGFKEKHSRAHGPTTEELERRFLRVSKSTCCLLESVEVTWNWRDNVGARPHQVLHLVSLWITENYLFRFVANESVSRRKTSTCFPGN